MRKLIIALLLLVPVAGFAQVLSVNGDNSDPRGGYVRVPFDEVTEFVAYNASNIVSKGTFFVQARSRKRFWGVEDLGFDIIPQGEVVEILPEEGQLCSVLDDGVTYITADWVATFKGISDGGISVNLLCNNAVELVGLPLE